MANYYQDQLNDFIESASDIQQFLSGECYNEFDNCQFNLNPEHVVKLENMMFFKINEYRLFNDKNDFAKKMQTEFAKIFDTYHASDCAIGFFLVFDDNKVSLYFSTEVKNEIPLSRHLLKTVPDIKCENVFISSEIKKKISNYCCVVTGIPDKRLDIDKLITSAANYNCIIAVLAKPIARQKSEYRKAYINELLNKCESLSTIDISFGEGSRQVVKRPQNGIIRLKNYLQTQLERVNKKNNFWQSCVWVCGQTQSQCKSVAASLAGLFSYSEDNISRKGRYFQINNLNPFADSEPLFLPEAIVGTVPNQAASLAFSSFCDFISTNELSRVTALPLYSYDGINAINPRVSYTDVFAFSTAVKRYIDGFEIGKNVYTGHSVQIPLSILKQHALFTGASGYGKTNAVMCLLKAVDENKIPFCVIESSKKEYFQLFDKVSSLSVYSTDGEGLPLRLNILEPEKGIRLTEHIENVYNVFCAAFDMEQATRSALFKLIGYTYRKKGFDLNSVNYLDGRIYPTINDMLSLTDEFCDTELDYDSRGEVGGNIRGTLKIRLSSLIEGAAGKALNTTRSIDTNTLFFKNSVIELDGLSDSAKSLISSFLLIKFREYIRQRDVNAQNVNNVIVAEEAHNIVGKKQPGQNNLSAKYFSNLLSEIRTYGTAVVIADQGASKLDDDVVRNTSLKVMLHSEIEDDANALRYAFGASEFQIGLGAYLNKGEAIISTGGSSQAQKVKINFIGENKVDNLACLFCDNKFMCNKSNTYRKVKESRYHINEYADELYSEFTRGRDLKCLAENITRSIGVNKSDSFCAIGKILTDSTVSYLGTSVKKRILNTLSSE